MPGREVVLRLLDMNSLGVDFGLAISPGRGKAMAEAGSVCLEGQGHSSGVSLRLQGDADHSHELRWPTVTDQIRRSWADEQEATEEGAAGIALLLIRQETSYSANSRSRKRTGIDFWLGSDPDVLITTARLEVSGILQGDASTIMTRVREKKRQTEQSDDSGLPVYVSVVEFSAPVAHLEEKQL